MLNFFSNKKSNKLIKVDDNDLSFLRQIINILPQEYKFLNDQINSVFLETRQPMIGLDQGNIGFGHNEELFESYRKPNFPESSELRNIKVKVKDSEEYTNLMLHLLNGTLWGYYLDPKFGTQDLDFSNIDINDLYLHKYENEALNLVKTIFSDFWDQKTIDFMDVDDVFEMEIEGKKYYSIKNLKDGNYLAIDSQAKVYGMIHDPYEIEEIFPDVSSYILAIKSSEFTPKSYLKSKGL